MESRAPALKQTDRVLARRRLWTNLAKTALGVTLLAALIFWGKIDLNVLLELAADPWAVVTCLALLFLALPLAALRWGIFLRALGVSIPFVNLFHFVAIGLLTNVLLLGSAGGDAVRGLYAWRALGRSGGRVAVSVLADRLFTLCAAPDLTRPIEARLLRWPMLVNLLAQARGMILMLRTDPLSLLAAFALALATQILTVFAVAVLAGAIKIGVLNPVDYMFAVPFTLIVNALPLTPSGIGVGEAAFDQICRWLEPTPSGAAYSSIFFAFRVVSTLTCIPGLISLAIYRNAARSHPPQ